MSDEIDLDELEKFINDLPPPSPEYLLEAVVEDDDLRLANEAINILVRWDRMAAIGQPIPLEVRRFEAEAFFTRHRVVGAEGVPGANHGREKDQQDAQN